MHDLVSTADIQLGVASGAFGEGSDNCTATLRAQRGGRLRMKSLRTHCNEMDTLVSELLGSPGGAGRLAVIMIYRLGRKCFDGKRVRDNLDGSSGRTVLTRGGLRFGLHGIFSTGISVTHKERRKGYKVLEYRRDG